MKSKEISDKKRLSLQIDTLTDENRRYFLGVLEALFFAQHTLEMLNLSRNRDKGMMKHHRDTVNE